MSKPRPYHLEQCPNSTGQNQFTLDLWVDDEDWTMDIIIEARAPIFLKPRSARAMAKRLIAMADWVEETHADPT